MANRNKHYAAPRTEIHESIVFPCKERLDGSCRPPHAGPMELESLLRDPTFLATLAARCARYGSESDDCFGELCLRLWEACVYGRYRPDLGSPSQYATGVLRRLSSEQARNRSRSHRDRSTHRIEHRPLDNPLAKLLSAEQSVMIRNLVDSLPREQRNVIVRSFGLGPGSNSSAPMTSTNRSNKSRAMARLSRRLAIR